MILAIADLHGRADLLEGLLGQVPTDTRFVFLGDAIDRGLRNRDTMRLLLELVDAGRMVLLKGNHEQIVEDVDATYDRFQQEPSDLRRNDALEAFLNWFSNGGEAVVREYGGFDSDAMYGGAADAFGPWGVPPELLEYIDRCVHEYRQGDILCSHAAPPTPVPGYRRLRDSMLWARPEEGPFTLPEGVRLSVHGHTPLQAPTRFGDSVFIDLGAVWTGNLCTFDLETERITVFRGQGSRPLEGLPMINPVNGTDPVVLEYEVVDL